MAAAVEPMQAKTLILDSLQVQNFRAFRHLEIPKLGRVNLITGKNSIGKTALLEAILFYGESGIASVVRRLLGLRDESWIPAESQSEPNLLLSSGTDELEEQPINVRFLFNGRKEISERTQPIVIGPREPTDRLLFWELNWQAEVEISAGPGGHPIKQPRQIAWYDRQQFPNAELVVNVRSPGRFSSSYPIAQLRPRQPAGLHLVAFVVPKDRPVATSYKVQLVNANGLEEFRIGTLWDAITTTPQENSIVEALQILAPNLERIVLVASEDGTSKARIPLAKIRGLSRVPMKSLGDGMNRLFSIALCAVNASSGFLLIDEIENGMHYSFLPDLWRTIFRLAHKLDVQVFATTHSWDCIEAFQIAAAEDKMNDGVLVRLQNKKGEVSATIFDEQRLAIATRDQIEVR